MNLNNLGRFQEILVGKNLDGFIVTNPINIFYLCGFRGISQTERESYLLFNPKPTLITPKLYQNEARKLASSFLKVTIAPERHLMFEKAKMQLLKCKSVGFEQDDLRYAEFQELGSLNLVPCQNLIENMRLTKSPDEIRKIEKAQDISHKAFAQITKTVKVGQTEEEITEMLTKFTKNLGGQGLAFESIIASGPNSGIPHYKTGKRKIKKGDLLLLDFGAKYQNYHADLSRTVVVGKAKDSHINIFRHVLEAQKKAIENIRAGSKPTDIYHVSNLHFKKHKLDQFFLHGLGHGVGLEIHEQPYLRPKIPPTNQQLAESMVFSVEPGLYFPWGGIRIEDLIVIQNGKAKVLGQTQKELLLIR